MKIEANTIYHLPTNEVRQDFLKQAEKEDFIAFSGMKPTKSFLFDSFQDNDFCVRVDDGKCLNTGAKNFYKSEHRYSHLPIVKWETSTPKVLRLNDLKFVINAPHVIVTDGTFTGKAKCNPSDTFDAAVGLELAIERYKGEKENSEIKIGERVKVVGHRGFVYMKPGTEVTVLSIKYGPRSEKVLLCESDRGFKQYIPIALLGKIKPCTR